MALSNSNGKITGLLPPHLASLLHTPDLQSVRVHCTNHGAPFTLKARFEATLTPTAA